MPLAEHAYLAPLFPLLACALILMLGRRAPGQGAYVAVGGMLLALVVSCGVFSRVAQGAGGDFSARWFRVGGVSVHAGVLVDPLSAVMLLVVSFVGLMIFIYSMGYMHGDPRYSRYFAYLSLFAAAMLGLVIADQLIVLYACWELVGLCSYLLIGFWFERPAAARAGKKAFLVTRLGDTGLLVGILLLVAVAGTANLQTLFRMAAGHTLPNWVLTAAALLIFCGAVGKSAQFPLHVWLPDAMEGPTPVSALIHAATMVAAGVYLVARCEPLLAAPASGVPLMTVAWIGAITAVMAASIAVVTNDIKRVLAYSTISQLGYMMLGVGAGSVVAGIFHLTTHAFFKALLFMAAGSIIHATQRQDMWELGGLARRMPVTFGVFLCGAAALAGLPPFSGFWSKDEILLRAFQASPALYGLGLFGAFLTAFYMTRMGIVTFLGQPRKAGEAHESPRVMTWPMVVLAVGAVGLGFVGTPWANWFHGFLAGGAGEQVSPEPLGLPLMAVSVAAALGGIALAYVMYGTGALSPAAVAAKLRPLYKTLKNKYWMDELYEVALIRPGMRLALLFRRVDEGGVDAAVNRVGEVAVGTSWLSNAFDHIVVDGLVNLIGWITRQVGAVGRFGQTGFAQDYMFWLAAGALVLILIGWLGP
jgi:NADH-quinone oxidoreductase subunit L